MSPPNGWPAQAHRPVDEVAETLSHVVELEIPNVPSDGAP